MESVTRK